MEKQMQRAVIGAGDYIGAEIAKKFAAEGFIYSPDRRDGAKLERWSGRSKRDDRLSPRARPRKEDEWRRSQ